MKTEWLAADPPEAVVLYKSWPVGLNDIDLLIEKPAPAAIRPFENGNIIVQITVQRLVGRNIGERQGVDPGEQVFTVNVPDGLITDQLIVIAEGNQFNTDHVEIPVGKRFFDIGE